MWLQVHTKPVTSTDFESTTPQVIWSTILCLTMRAIHLEVAENLTTESVILALSCLIPRTGYDRVITTDNSTKIVGSESKLRESINNLINLKVTLHLNTKNISLNLNPPPSTWMLGSWESIMKSVTRG